MCNSVFRNIHTLLVVVIWVILAINAAKRVKITTTVERVVWCEHPDPPYPNPMKILNNIQVNTERGKPEASGEITICTEVPVNNVSIRIYSKSGNYSRDKLQFEVKGATCRNIFVKAYLKMTAVHSDERRCTIAKGNYTFRRFRLLQLARVGPTWIQEGHYMLEARLCSPSHTLYCQEIHVCNDKQ